MSNNASQANKSPAGVAHFVIFGLVAVGIFSAIFWHLRHDAIATGGIWLSWLLDVPPYLVGHLLGWPADWPGPTGLMRRIIASETDIENVGPGDLLSMIGDASRYYVFLLIYPIFKMVRNFANHPYNHTNRVHDFHSLVAVQSRNNPCIVPVYRFEKKWREKKLPRHPNICRALQPDEFANKYKLIVGERGSKTLDVEKTEKLLAGKDHLGLRLSQVKKLPDYYRALAAIFAIRIVGIDGKGRNSASRKLAKKLMDGISMSCNPDASAGRQFSFSEPAKYYDQYTGYGDIATLRERHGYMKTFLMALMEQAAQDGKLPMSDIIWLKMVDRSLFYALHAVSPAMIASAMTEAAAPMAQYLAEKVAFENGVILEGEHIAEAIPAMEKCLMDVGAIDKLSVSLG